MQRKDSKRFKSSVLYQFKYIQKIRFCVGIKPTHIWLSGISIYLCTCTSIQIETLFYAWLLILLGTQMARIAPSMCGFDYHADSDFSVLYKFVLIFIIFNKLYFRGIIQRSFSLCLYKKKVVQFIIFCSSYLPTMGNQIKGGPKCKRKIRRLNNSIKCQRLKSWLESFRVCCYILAFTRFSYPKLFRF